MEIIVSGSGCYSSQRHVVGVVVGGAAAHEEATGGVSRVELGVAAPVDMNPSYRISGVVVGGRESMRERQCSTKSTMVGILESHVLA